MPTLRELRVSRDISQRRLAELAGVSKLSVQHAEWGKPVQRTTIAKICTALDIQPSEISGVIYHSAVRSALKRERRKTEKPR